MRYNGHLKRGVPGADPGFQVRGAHLKKLRRAEGGAKIVRVFRVKKHDFMPKNHIFSKFSGGGVGCPPPLDPPLGPMALWNESNPCIVFNRLLCVNLRVLATYACSSYHVSNILICIVVVCQSQGPFHCGNRKSLQMRTFYIHNTRYNIM